MNSNRILGLALIGVGIVLYIFFNDKEFLWFTGGPLGFVLIILGAIESAQSFIKRRSEPSPRDRSIKEKVSDFFK